MTTWTTYQGIEVADVQPKVPARHPRWGYRADRLATLQGASLLMLADGILLVVCDDCGFNGITGKEPYVKPEGEQKEILKQSDSVASHRNGTHNLSVPRGSMYTDDQIKVAIKVWLKWRATGIRSWVQAACDELERLGFKPYQSDKWRPGQLGHLVRTYKDKDKFKNLKPASLSEADKLVLGALTQEPAEPKRRRAPINFSEIIATSEAAKAARQEAGVVVPDPTLNFVTQRTNDLDPGTLVIETEKFTKPVPERVTALVAEADPLSEFNFQHIADLPDGTVLFKYKGTLMVGKTVKGFEV